MANPSLDDHAPHLSVTQARQAFRGRHILMVLIASLALAAMALGLAWAWRAGDFHRADSSAAARIAAASPAAAPRVIARPPQPPNPPGM
jgi:hypothetical protein